MLMQFTKFSVVFFACILLVFLNSVLLVHPENMTVRSRIAKTIHSILFIGLDLLEGEAVVRKDDYSRTLRSSST